MTDIEIPEGFERWDSSCPIPYRFAELIMSDGTRFKTKRPQAYNWSDQEYREEKVIAYRVLP